MKVSKAITVGRPPSEVYAFWRDQTPVHRYMRPLLDRIQNGEIDPSVVITHRLPLADAAHGYKIFLHKEDRCEKVVLKA
jgi:threonine dehydrogenase-like Zn-dependent dehydrogenase